MFWFLTARLLACTGSSKGRCYSSSTPGHTRRVDAVNVQGSQVAVLTDTASLPDLMQDGTVQFKVPVDFSDQLTQRTAYRHQLQKAGTTGRYLSLVFSSRRLCQ